MGAFAIGPGLRETIHERVQSLLGARALLRSETQDAGELLFLRADLDASLSVRETVDMFDAAVRILAECLPHRGVEPRWMLSLYVGERILLSDVGGLVFDT